MSSKCVCICLICLEVPLALCPEGLEERVVALLCQHSTGGFEDGGGGHGWAEWMMVNSVPRKVPRIGFEKDPALASNYLYFHSIRVWP